MGDPTLITFGCRLNIAESEAMRSLAQGQDDLVIVNSCAVTGEAVRQARQAIRRAKRERPDARIVVTGCAAQTDPAMFAAMPEVDSILGNREKMQARSFTPAPLPFADTPQRVRVSDIMAVRDTAPHLITAFADRARAFVEVQNGCDHRCTFCIIPYGRGNSRSVPAGAVIDRVKALVDEGYKEIVLTGVDVTSYGADLPGAPNLGSLVERLLTHVPDLPRLRLSSLDSVEIDDRLFALITQEKRVMPHLHLSLQAGDDLILKRMKRRHSRADAIRLVERLLAARPDISIGADIIAGFPTETEGMFANSLALVHECHIVHGHIFPYSPRTGTPAARMPQVDKAAIRDRAARLRAACADNRARWLTDLVGTVQHVVAEGDGSHGHAENFAPVRLPRRLERGEIARVAISGVEKDRLIAQEAQS
ncbi:MAG: tRNA (N(6)-L-threonylcarbamoyladenosine(37)-C(2))-methylthiotransferase MtaB [Sphingobium sp.]